MEWLERGHEPLDDTQRDFIEPPARSPTTRYDGWPTRRVVNVGRTVGCACWSPSPPSCLVVAAAAGVVAREQGLAAERGEASARGAAATARHERLVALSLSLRQTDRALAAMLAVLAWRQEPGALAQSALVGVLAAEPGFLGYRYIPQGDAG